MYRYVIVSAVLLAVGFLTGWTTQSWRLGEEIATLKEAHAQELVKLQQAALNTEKAYREKERSYQTSLAVAQEKRNEETRRINARHAAVVDSLRNRQERTTSGSSEVPNPAPSCAGTTGSELARGDAEFLAGFAADAAKLDAALTQCEAAYNAVLQTVK